jgi:lysophospholipase L1-like esterase
MFGIIIFFGFYFYHNNEYIVNYPPKSNVIVAFGDSLVEGTGSINNGDFVSVLSKKIGRPIVNLGIYGNTTAQGLARIDEVLAYNPGVVLVLFGGNDYLHDVPRNEVFQNLDTMVRKLQSHGAVVILLGIRGGIFADPYDPLFRKLAKTRGTLYVPDVLSGLIGNTKYMSDAVHPNNLGYDIIASRIYPELKKVLQK